MRTTIDVGKDLIQAAKARASEQQSTLSHVVGEALRACLLLTPEGIDQPFELLTFGTRGGGYPSPAGVASILDEEEAGLHTGPRTQTPSC